MKVLLLPLLLLAGCSSVSVLEESETAALAPVSRPAALWVRPFEVPRGAEFDAAAAGGDDPRARIGAAIAEGILSRDRWIAPGRLLEPDAAMPSGGLLVEGKLLRTRQGSRALRLGLGFGAGRTRLETTVRVFHLDYSAKEPWLTFETTGGSNMEPGLAAMLVPSPLAIPVAVSVVGGAATAGAVGVKGVTEDALRTGRTIAAAIHDRLAERGAVKREVRPKRAGRVPTPAGELPLPAPALPE